MENEKVVETVVETVKAQETGPDPILAQAISILIAQGNEKPTDEQVKLLVGILRPMLSDAEKGLPLLSKESRDALENAAKVSKELGIQILFDPETGISYPDKKGKEKDKKDGEKREVNRVDAYTVKGPEGKTFLVKKDTDIPSLKFLAKQEGLWDQYWVKHPPKKGKDPEKIPISCNKIISSFKGWSVSEATETVEATK